MANPSTTNPLQIKDVQQGILIFKDGSVRGVVQVDAINFELRSTDEQTAIIQQFQGFLNSVDFPIQMVVNSRIYNVETYLATVQTASEQLTNELLKLQAQEYIRFVRELSSLANIMSKKFYVVIPLSVSAQTETKGFLSGITGMFKKSAAPAGVSPENLATYQNELAQRADLILGGLSGMGLKGHMLNQDELVSLLTDLYNPTGSPAVAPQPHA